MAETAVTAIVSALGGVGAAVGGMAAYLRAKGKSSTTLEEMRRESTAQHAAVLATAERIQQSLEAHMMNEREYQAATLTTLGEIGRGIAVLLDRARP